MRFRPAWGMSIAALVALVLLIGLGTWQVMRLQWKSALIEEFKSRALAEAIAPPEEAQEIHLYQRLKLDGVWMHEGETQLTGRVFEGTAGYHVITPLELEDGRIILVNRGWVSQDYRRPETRPSTLAEGQVSVMALLRLPIQKGYFVPPNAPSQDDWFTLNIADIAEYHQLGDRLITAYTADAIRGEGAYVLPIGARVEINIPNDHLNYALTWYGIALGLIGVYVVWHLQAGRLRFGRKKDSL